MTWIDTLQPGTSCETALSFYIPGSLLFNLHLLFGSVSRGLPLFITLHVQTVGLDFPWLLFPLLSRHTEAQSSCGSLGAQLLTLQSPNILLEVLPTDKCSWVLQRPYSKRQKKAPSSVSWRSWFLSHGSKAHRELRVLHWSLALKIFYFVHVKNNPK